MKINLIKYNYSNLKMVKPSFSALETDDIPDEKLDTKTLMKDIALQMQALQRKFEILQKRVDSDINFSSENIRTNPIDKRLDEVLLVPGKKKAFAFSAILSENECNYKHVKRIIEHLDSIKPSEHQLVLIKKIINYSKENKDKNSLTLIANYCGQLSDKYRHVNGEPQRQIPLDVYDYIYKTALEIDGLEAISDTCFNLYESDKQNEIMAYALKTKNTGWIEYNLHLFKGETNDCLLKYMDICLEQSQGMDLELVYDNVYKNKNSYYQHDKEFLKSVDEKLNKYVPFDAKEKKIYKKLKENMQQQMSV